MWSARQLPADSELSQTVTHMASLRGGAKPAAAVAAPSAAATRALLLVVFLTMLLLKGTTAQIDSGAGAPPCGPGTHTSGMCEIGIIIHIVADGW